MQAALVIDNGSFSIKSGLANSKPSLMPCLEGRPKYEAVLECALQESVVSGSRMQEMQGLLSLSSPMSRGVITDYESMARIWNNVFSSLDKAKHPVLLTEAALTTTA